MESSVTKVEDPISATFQQWTSDRAPPTLVMQQHYYIGRVIGTRLTSKRTTQVDTLSHVANGSQSSSTFPPLRFCKRRRFPKGVV